MKIKIDPRIKSLIDTSATRRERSIFMIVGDRGRDRVVDLHLLLSKSQLKARPSVLWCYKEELGFSSHRKKRIRQIKRAQQKGNYDTETDDPFELFISSTEIRYCYYKESHTILGTTFGMLVLQDFESLTPNLLCRTIETVEGGGLVVFLLKNMSNLRQLYTIAMDVHQRYRSEKHIQVEPRFNERFLLSLSTCRGFLAVDDEFNILNISPKACDFSEYPVSSEDSQLRDLQISLSETQPIGTLLQVCKTVDQAKVVMATVSALLEHKQTTLAVTAARGRGKSAALGLAVSAAISCGYSNVLVTAPSPENLQAFFEFLLAGLTQLGYVEHREFEVLKGSRDLKHCIIRVTISKTHRQIVQYVTVNSAVTQTDLLVVDEAAAIPLPLVKKLIGAYPVLMSSTVHGYEGTGRALSLKLFQSMQNRGLQQLKMETPIRYATNDPVEKWLSDLLCLEATTPQAVKSAPPHPAQCSLYRVNRDTLFSFHRASELFLHQMMSLFVSSHYKNTPNDLQLMSDAPAHELFVLLGPLTASSSLPDVLCAIQVCYEGGISKAKVQEQLAAGYLPAGDLIPWTLSNHYQEQNFGELTGARVVRIACHPDLQNMGYGSRALEELSRFFNGELFTGEKQKTVSQGEESIQEPEALAPRKGIEPLLKQISEVPVTSIDYLGVSFGVSQQLFNFWKRSGFQPLYLRQTSSDVTGEHSVIMVKPYRELDLSPYLSDFRARMLWLLAYDFRHIHPTLAFSIIGHTSAIDLTSEAMARHIDLYQLKRLEAYNRNVIDHSMILDLVPVLTRLIFEGKLNVELTGFQQALMLALGLQHKGLKECSELFSIEEQQITAVFNKVLIKAVERIRAIYEGEIGLTLPQKRPREDDQPKVPRKKAQ